MGNPKKKVFPSICCKYYSIFIPENKKKHTRWEKEIPGVHQLLNA